MYDLKNNLMKELATRFNVPPQNIATNPHQITPKKTKVYCGGIVGYDENGNLLPEFVRLLPKLKRMDIKIFVYPNEEVKIIEVKSEGKDPAQLLKEIKDNNGSYSDWAEKTTQEIEITPKNTILKVAIIEVGWLKLNKDTTQNIWKISEKMGLKNCPLDLPLILGSKKEYHKLLMGKFLSFKIPITSYLGDSKSFSLNLVSYKRVRLDVHRFPTDKWNFRSLICFSL